MELLPAGSVVTLKGCSKRLMIYSILEICEENERVYDYLACLYPEGYWGEEYNFLFDHKDIERVEFTGFTDPEFQQFREKVMKEFKENPEDEQEELEDEK